MDTTSSCWLKTPNRRNTWVKLDHFSKDKGWKLKHTLKPVCRISLAMSSWEKTWFLSSNGEILVKNGKKKQLKHTHTSVWVYLIDVLTKKTSVSHWAGKNVEKKKLRSPQTCPYTPYTCSPGSPRHPRHPQKISLWEDPYRGFRTTKG